MWGDEPYQMWVNNNTGPNELEKSTKYEFLTQL